MVFVDLGHASAIMPPPEQIPNERYVPGARMKMFLVSVNMTPKGPEVIVSRAHTEMVRRLFAIEVPEISAASVEIKAIAREAGSRTKIAVFSNQKNIDPVGSCVGQRGTRVQTVISELGGEKIDIVEWSDDPIKFISNSLSPAKILSIKTNQAEKSAIAEVREDQMSLAIGRGGQNVRLAAKLTGWRIDIVAEGQNLEERMKEREALAAAKDGSGTQPATTEAVQPETTPVEGSSSEPETAKAPAPDQSESAPVEVGQSPPEPVEVAKNDSSVPEEKSVHSDVTPSTPEASDSTTK
jgi:transcription antitermination factor NusA-like protein